MGLWDDIKAGAQKQIDAQNARVQAYEDAQKKIVCQFCQTPGHVTSRQVKRVKRKTATRIIGGIATMGGSLAVTGVSKKGYVTEMTCGNCRMTWDLGSV